MTACPYETLGLSPGASEKEVKQAYRALAHKWHPDTYTGSDTKAAEVRFRNVAEAYQSLSSHGTAGMAGSQAARNETGASWQRRTRRPKSTGSSTDAEYWHARARMHRPQNYYESEFRMPPGGRVPYWRIFVAPAAFLVGLALCVAFSEESSKKSSSGAASSRRPTVDAVWNHRKQKWVAATEAMRKDPVLASTIRQQPVHLVSGRRPSSPA